VIDLTPVEMAAAMDARLVSGREEARAGDRPAKATIDSRAIEAGDLFFGLPGETADGGEFAGDAIDAGAWGVVLSEAPASTAPHAGARIFATPDPLAALGGLAARRIESLHGRGCRIVGITGSTGKTSTKDILLALVRPVVEGRAHANRENWNTEIGLPLTALEAPDDVEVLVLEMAMRGMGQIRELARIARPDVGVITNVGPVHLELMGSLDRVAEAKAELIAELMPGATCVVPAAEEALSPHLRNDLQTLTFGTGIGTEADVRALSVEPLNSGLRAEIAVGEERITLDLPFTQAHNVTNTLAAVAAAKALGIDPASLAEGAAQIRLSSLRGQEIELPSGVLIINDCYNANPVSMRAALDHLAQIAARRDAPRAVAVLGEMRELGPDAERYHEEVGSHAAGRADMLIAVGPFAGAYERGYGRAGEAIQAAEAADAADLVREVVRDGDVVLLKASRAVGLEVVADALATETNA
jgi:UDP-N-acetylmuramoyl-tripeptide--D-alanyl-D-alanine ligase